MLSLVLFPNDFTSSTLSTVSDVFGGFSPFIVIVVGTLIAITGVVLLIRAFHH